MELLQLINTKASASSANISHGAQTQQLPPSSSILTMPLPQVGERSSVSSVLLPSSAEVTVPLGSRSFKSDKPVAEKAKARSSSSKALARGKGSKGP